jgi:hypothetical protein
MTDQEIGALVSTLRTYTRAKSMPSDLRTHPRYVDWGTYPDAVVCAECGEKGLDRGGVIVHGGVPFEHDPYEWYFGKRDRSKWEGILEVRIQHDHGVPKP